MPMKVVMGPTGKLYTKKNTDINKKTTKTNKKK